MLTFVQLSIYSSAGLWEALSDRFGFSGSRGAQSLFKRNTVITVAQVMVESSAKSGVANG